MATEREKETYKMAAVKVHQLTRIRKMSLLFQTQHNVTELVFLILGFQKPQKKNVRRIKVKKGSVKNGTQKRKPETSKP